MNRQIIRQNDGASRWALSDPKPLKDSDVWREREAEIKAREAANANAPLAKAYLKPVKRYGAGL